MNSVRAKKHLGQHFLKDQQIAKKIAESLTSNVPDTVLEIGPGMGVLTQFLLQNQRFETSVVEIDTESVIYLQKHFPQLEGRIITGDFLKMNLANLFDKPFAIIGNFPYNISSQILFKIIEHRDKVPEMVGMFQKEVAERVASKHGNKTYGILSVLLQAFYTIEYLFTVHENVFDPPPKVKSGVIRITRNSTTNLPCNEALFFRIVKTGFNQRRKTLSNSLKSILLNLKPEDEIFRKRPEQLNVQEFIELTLKVEKLLEEKI
ncbi:MAG: 16S rRNA (adenine(1518)-N(6)/adenine(1519)-N(6))-dimethyltransferase [Bacteroidetes bacterium HGW-Bacteroidetes-4]|jgi:16S rRNA (adenine1518-N6/adenine1519-N6)-dimethyltransferase|nr:MAG: 16S rRNA (adenine(1518)-N(6)/adenine(1519)-N(6))-dimethyltransferase [Bacteroidetes bacterium HGW-Bacteroidetes-4]